MELIRIFWRGEAGLGATFWGLGLVMPLVMNWVLKAFGYYSMTGGYIKEGQDFIDAWFITLPMIAFGFFILICTWRAATDYIADATSDVRALWGKSVWGYLAKLMVVVGVPIQLLAIYNFLISI